MTDSVKYNKNLIFVAACVGMCFFGIATITLGSILPQLTTTLGFNNLQAAALVAFMPAGSLAGSIFFGPIVDRFGHKIMLVLGSIILLLGLQGVSCFVQVWLLQISIFAIGLGGGILNGETNALAADISEPHEKGSKLSILGVFYGVGAISIPLLLGVLSEYFTYKTILHGLGVIMIISIVFFMVSTFPEPKQAKGFPIKKGFGLLRKKGLILLSFILFFESGIEVCCSTWTTSYFDQVTEITREQALTALTMMIMGLTLSRIALAFIYRKFKQEKVLPYCLLIGFIGFALLSGSPDYLRAYIGMFLIGAGLSATFPTVLSLIGAMFAELSGTAFSIALAIGLIGQILFNYCTGVISEWFDGMNFFPFMMMGGVILMLILFFIKMKTGKKITT